MTSKQHILDQTLALASRQGWEALTLNQLAQAMNISLAAVYQHFPQKDDLVEAWFDLADRQLLSRVPCAEWAPLRAEERLERVERLESPPQTNRRNAALQV